MLATAAFRLKGENKRVCIGPQGKFSAVTKHSDGMERVIHLEAQEEACLSYISMGVKILPFLEIFIITAVMRLKLKLIGTDGLGWERK